MIALIRKFIKPRTMVREKILATKVGVCVLLEDLRLLESERTALEGARDALGSLLSQHDLFTHCLVRDGD